MFTLKMENRNGDILELTHNKNYIVTDIDGLDPPQASINWSDVVGMAGGLYNNSKVEPRNLVISVMPRKSVEKNRIALYQYAQLGEWCKIYYSNNSINVQIEGYVETIEVPTFTQKEQAQISIICPQPYFEGLKEIYNDISAIVGNFEFPFAIEQPGIEFSYVNRDMLAHVTNYGNVSTGVTISITASGQVENPVVYNTDTKGSIGVKITMQEYDQIIINTNSGQRDIKLIRNNIEKSILNCMRPNPEWFVLKPGENVFSYDADSGVESLSVAFSHRTKYGGV